MPSGRRRRRPRRIPVVPGGGEGTKWVVSVMSGSDRAGRWRLGREVAVVNVMGGADIDLNDAELTSERTVLTVFSLMGGSTVYVPDGLNVEVSEFSVMGGNGIKLGEPIRTRRADRARAAVVDHGRHRPAARAARALERAQGGAAAAQAPRPRLGRRPARGPLIS